jgi:hypothetical protein
MKKWLAQTSTRAALGTALTTAAAIATGQADWKAALLNLIPVVYGAIVSDKAS